MVNAHATNPSDGDVWSLNVNDQDGKVVFEGERNVTYEQSYEDDCQTCESAEVDF